MDTTPTSPPVFDGHNDVLTVLHKAGGVGKIHEFIDGRDSQIDLPKARSGGFAGGFFAVWIPASGDYKAIMAEMRKPAYSVPLADPIPQPQSLAVALAQIDILNHLEKAGALRICLSVTDIRDSVAEGRLAAILHLEGAEPIDPDFHVLHILARAGLRSIGPVWSRPTAYGEGVPFRFPSGPDIGGGLTDDGKRLVRACNDLGLLIDLSHINEAGFRDIADLSDAPLVATHSNAHAICPHSRNLTDDQLRMIAASGGLVGLNFATAMLRDDGRMEDDVPLGQMLRHLDHMLDILGEGGVALGSDFDGATVPRDIGNVAGLPALRTAMIDHGYGPALIEKICFENWMRVLDATWKT